MMVMISKKSYKVKTTLIISTSTSNVLPDLEGVTDRDFMN